MERPCFLQFTCGRRADSVPRDGRLPQTFTPADCAAAGLWRNREFWVFWNLSRWCLFRQESQSLFLKSYKARVSYLMIKNFISCNKWFIFYYYFTCQALKRAVTDNTKSDTDHMNKKSNMRRASALNRSGCGRCLCAMCGRSRTQTHLCESESLIKRAVCGTLRLAVHASYN